MEGLRGFAVFLVFLVHYFTLVEPWLTQGTAMRIAAELTNVGHSGVDLFFVLSGFLIYGTLIAKKRPFIPYFKRRIQRIYPTFLCVFAIYVALSLLMPSESKIPDGLWRGTTYILANLLLLPGLAPIEPVITVAWSLSYEVFYYLITPVAIGILVLRQWQPPLRAAFALLLAAAIFVYAWSFGGHVRLAMFVSGILLYETLRPIPAHLADKIGFAGLVGAIVAVALVAALEIHPGARFVGLFVAYYLLGYGSLAANGACARTVSCAPRRWHVTMRSSSSLLHGHHLPAFFMAVGIVLAPRPHALLPWL